MSEGAPLVNDDRIIKLLGAGKQQEFQLPVKAALQSVLLGELIEGLGANVELDEDEDSQEADDKSGIMDPIELDRVGDACLQKVVEFLIYHAQDPMEEIPHPLPHDTFELNVPKPYYQKFFDDENMPNEMLFDLLRAANYMDIKTLLDLACLKITFMLNGKSEDEIREILHLPAMTPEEEEAARAQHPWIFDGN